MNAITGCAYLQVVFFALNGNDGIEMVRLNRCGPIALRVATEAIGRTISIAMIESTGPEGDAKWTFADLKKSANTLGFQTTARSFPTNPISFAKGEAAAIARIFLSTGEPHFVAFIECRSDAVLVDNFPQDQVVVSVEALREKYGWDGSLLFVYVSKSFAARITAIRDARNSYFFASGIFMLAAVSLAVRGRKRDRKKLACGVDVRNGFTIVEMLVSLGIISLLMALLLPAVLQVRGRALTSSCANNLHQIGVAMSSFESSFGCYPNPNQIPGVALDLPPATRAFFSPHVGLLPHLDQSTVFAKIDFRNDVQSNADPATTSANPQLLLTSIAVFKCPADSLDAGGNSYRGCQGTAPNSGTTPQLNSRIAALVGWHNGANVRPQDVTDGLSTTAFFAERLSGGRKTSVFQPYRDVALGAKGRFLLPEDAVVACASTIPANPPHLSFVGSTWLYFGSAETGYNHVLEPNAHIVDCTDANGPNLQITGAVTTRSLHTGGVNVLMGDGSVRFVASSIDRTLWRAIGSISGNETVGEF